MLCRPLHTKAALLFSNATSLLDHLSAKAISSKFGVDEQVYAQSANYGDCEPIPAAASIHDCLTINVHNLLITPWCLVWEKMHDAK